MASEGTKVGSDTVLTPERDRRSFTAEEIVEMGIWRLPETNAIDTLVTALPAADDVHKAIYLNVLGETRDERVIPTLIEYTHDSHDGVREAAVEALGNFPVPSAVATILAALDDHDKHVRKRAASALKVIAAVDRALLTQAAMRSASEAVRAETLQILERLPQDDSASKERD